MAAKPGFPRKRDAPLARLGARFAFVNMITWESLEQFAAARDAGYQKLTAADWFSVSSAPYEVFHERRR